MIEFFGRGGALKPSWYGDCLPSRDFPMLIDLYLQGRLALDRFVCETIAPRRGRGGVPQDGAGRGAALRRRALIGRRSAHRAGPHQRDLLARRRGLRGREQHLAGRRRPRGAGHRRRARRRADRRRRSATGAWWRSSAPTATTTTSTPPPTLADARRRAGAASTPTTACSGTSSTPTARPTARCADGDGSTVAAATSSRVLHTPGPLARRRVPARCGADGHGVRRRHAVQRRPGRDRPLVLRLPARSSSRSAPGCSRCPADTVVHTGHGDDTTIGDEAPHLDEWIARGH